MDKEKTKVVFRKFKDGEIIAFFPEIQADQNYDNCQSYQHVGQHGAASYGLLDITKLAAEAEYQDLYNELTSIGYNLKIQKRIVKKWFNA